MTAAGKIRVARDDKKHSNFSCHPIQHVQSEESLFLTHLNNGTGSNYPISDKYGPEPTSVGRGRNEDEPMVRLEVALASILPTSIRCHKPQDCSSAPIIKDYCRVGFAGPRRNTRNGP
jgi:hypothetical protein